MPTFRRSTIAAGIVLASLCIAPRLLIAAEGSRTIVVGGTGCALAAMEDMAQAFQKKHPELAIKIIPSLGSGGGIKGVLAGSLDLALSARPLTEWEKSQGASAKEYARAFYFCRCKGFANARGDVTASGFDICRRHAGMAGPHADPAGPPPRGRHR